MPVFEIGLDDGRKLRIEADDQEAALAGVVHFQEQEKASAPSGVFAGLRHGGSEVLKGDLATGKDFAGIDAPGAAGVANTIAPQNYVPANVTQGSFNPLNWHLKEIPQAVAEALPGVTQDVIAGTTAAKTAKMAGASAKMAALAGLIGGAGSTWTRIAGRNAETDAANRTGDANAAPAAEDLARGGIRSIPEAAIAALLPTRLIPGANKVATVSAQGVYDAGKKFLGTAATGAVGAAGSDAVNQVTTADGKPFDPTRSLEAAVQGAATGGVMAAPRLAVDAGRATANREFGGQNMDATRAVATRIKDAGDGDLGKTIGGGKADFRAMESVKADVGNELQDAARNVRRETRQNPLSAEADNALQRAQSGKPLNAEDVNTIARETAGTPSGDNATFLARQARMLQLLQEKGSYDRGQGIWSGGLSGVMDKSLPWITNPAKALTGAAATAAGLHLLGTASPAFAAAGIGSYGGARLMDALTGMRSPAKTFAEHYADRNALTRLPTNTPPPPPPGPPPRGPWNPAPPAPAYGPTGTVTGMGPAQVPTGPWGPRPPMAGPTGPQVPPPAPPAPPAPKMPWSTPQISELWNGPSPIAAAMLKQRLKEGLPPEPAPPAPAPEPAPTPPPISPMALSMLKQKLKQGLPPEPAPTPEPTPAPVAAAPASAAIPNDVLRATKALMEGRAKVDKMKATSEAPSQPINIRKKNGKVNETAPAASIPFEPIAEEHLYPKDISAQEYAARETAKYGATGARYLPKAERTAQRRINIAADLTAKYPQYRHAISGLLRQLHAIGRDPADIASAVDHYASLVPADVGKALEAFK